MLGMYNQYIKNDASHKCVPCSVIHGMEVRHQIQRRMVSETDRLEFNWIHTHQTGDRR
jgi:hypothetical protein